MICPRCEQDEVVKVQVRATEEILHLCRECDATWFSVDAVGRDAFIDFSTYMEETGLPPMWSSLYVLEPNKITSDKEWKYLLSVGSILTE